MFRNLLFLYFSKKNCNSQLHEKKSWRNHKKIQLYGIYSRFSNMIIQNGSKKGKYILVNHIINNNN